MSDERPTVEEIAKRITGYATLRWDIMKLADEENALRQQLIAVQTLKNQGITKLVEFADSILTKALPEYDTEGKLKKEYKYVPGIAGPAVEAVAEFTNPSRRTCGLCHEPGHTRANCPDAHTIQEEKKEVATIKQNRETLAAANKLAGKRACSNCHKPGHRAKNCTEPVVVKRRRGKK